LLVFVGEVQGDFEEGFGEGVGVEVVHVGEDDDRGGFLWGEEDGSAGALLAAVVADEVEAEFVGDAPAEGIGGELAVSGVLTSQHHFLRGGLEELAGEDGGFEIGHVVGGGGEAAAGNFVTGVEDAGVADGAGFVAMIPAGAMRDDGEEVVGLGVVHGGGAENIFADVVDIFLRGSAFEDATEQRVAVGGVMELRAGLGEERVGGKELERFFHGGEVAGAVFGHVTLAVVVIVANAGEVGEELAGGDGGIF